MNERLWNRRGGSTADVHAAASYPNNREALVHGHRTATTPVNVANITRGNNSRRRVSRNRSDSHSTGGSSRKRRRERLSREQFDDAPLAGPSAANSGSEEEDEDTDSYAHRSRAKRRKCSLNPGDHTKQECATSRSGGDHHEEEARKQEESAKLRLQRIRDLHSKGQTVPQEPARQPFTSLLPMETRSSLDYSTWDQQEQLPTEEQQHQRREGDPRLTNEHTQRRSPRSSPPANDRRQSTPPALHQTPLHLQFHFHTFPVQAYQPLRLSSQTPPPFSAAHRPAFQYTGALLRSPAPTSRYSEQQRYQLLNRYPRTSFQHQHHQHHQHQHQYHQHQYHNQQQQQQQQQHQEQHNQHLQYTQPQSQPQSQPSLNRLPPRRHRLASWFQSQFVLSPPYSALATPPPVLAPHGASSAVRSTSTAAEEGSDHAPSGGQQTNPDLVLLYQDNQNEHLPMPPPVLRSSPLSWIVTGVWPDLRHHEESPDFLEAQTRSLYETMNGPVTPDEDAIPPLPKIPSPQGYTRSLNSLNFTNSASIVCTKCSASMLSENVSWFLRLCGHLYCKSCAKTSNSSECTAPHCQSSGGFKFEAAKEEWSDSDSSDNDDNSSNDETFPMFREVFF